MSLPTDHGQQPYVVDIEQLTLQNNNFRTTIWTGRHLQLTVMSIPVGGDIGLEVHQEVDQFLRVEAGTGTCQMGPTQDHLDFTQEVGADEAIFVPAGTWHNVTNSGQQPLRLYTIYGPPDHLAATVHATQADAHADPNEH